MMQEQVIMPFSEKSSCIVKTIPTSSRYRRPSRKCGRPTVARWAGHHPKKTFLFITATTSATIAIASPMRGIDTASGITITPDGPQPGNAPMGADKMLVYGFWKDFLTISQKITITGLTVAASLQSGARCQHPWELKA
jgi:hypothetical protein